jgi:D-sedoheptulose 7-phosphate isomerase
METIDTQTGQDRQAPQDEATREAARRAQVARLASLAAARLAARNPVSAAFFAAESERLARACQEMAERFLRGGRLLAFGRAHYATDAQHVAVEFVHPVIVGKRALPALDLSLGFGGWLAALLRPDDMVMGFGPPGGDPEVAAALAWARARGAQTFALAGRFGAGPREEAAGQRAGQLDDAGRDDPLAYVLPPTSPDPYIHQEIVEILYHTLWETVHVFFEHRERGHEVGASSFLYPYLARQKQDTGLVIVEVAASIRGKAEEDERLRMAAGRQQGEAIAAAAAALAARLRAGGKLIFFGNGGSATDANDWALDCAVPLAGFPAIPALSLAMEPANVTAVANDIGSEAIFLRQLIAHARPEDAAVAISTSGGSANILAALGEARKRGLLTVALLGYGGGEIVRRGLADFPVVVECDYIPRIQEIQASIYHVMLELLAAAAVPEGK